MNDIVILLTRMSNNT